MCGIAGIVSFSAPINANLLLKMTELISYRGPDGEGFLLCENDRKLSSLYTEEEKEGWRNKEISFGLGHRRLAILDLSQAGRQPMSTPDGQLWIVHNGEIYNYIEIRSELETKGYRFSTHTDTEIILYAYREWGTDCLGRFNGMWAFAILDLRKGILFCSRDRAGVKPFYYFFNEKVFAFSSEIKQLLLLPWIKPEVNPGVLYDYLFYGIQEHSEQTFFENINSLPGGHFIQIPLKGTSNNLDMKIYWDPELEQREMGDDEEYAGKLLDLLKDSIRLRLRSDVRVGSCLSGGLDSSGIVCLLDSERQGSGSSNKQLTFSSCFEDPRWDERKYIFDVIKKTGVEARYVFPSAEELTGILNKLTYHQDGPFGSTSIFAQWKVFESARKNGVTVMLDGQGADELLAGYYPYLPSFWWGLLREGKWFSLLNELIWITCRNPVKVKETLIEAAKAFVYQRMRKNSADNNQVSWTKPDFLQIGAEKSPYKKYLNKRGLLKKQKGGGELNWKLYESFRFTSLPALLRYEDRNSMAFSVEARLPFLDYRIVEFLLGLPPEQKIQRGMTKAVYRRAMKSVLPTSVLSRTDKMGFVTPEEIWIKNALKDIMDETFKSVHDDDQYFSRQGLLDLYYLVLKGEKGFSFLPWRLFNSIIWLNSLSSKGMSLKPL